ncbi:hypothetical protein [Hymenobacter terrenus]|uniref:hypothetical protein n=1 Tax=Hymenobacter terrenus TaxID=1629124 RepID=UPI0012E02E5A|nr:hypothetical protein [Hymenobacter terrenus]
MKDAEPVTSPSTARASHSTLSGDFFGPPGNTHYTGDFFGLEWNTFLIGTLGFPQGMATSATLEFRIGSKVVLVVPDVAVTYYINLGNNFYGKVDYNMPTFLQSANYTVVLRGNNGGLAYNNAFRYQLQGDFNVVRKANTLVYGNGAVNAGPQVNGTIYNSSIPLYWSTSIFGSNDVLRLFLTEQVTDRATNKVADGITYDVGIYSQTAAYDGRGVFTNSGNELLELGILPNGNYRLILTNTVPAPSAIQSFRRTYAEGGTYRFFRD